VLALEAIAPGGQAGSSSRIENYLGFPLGISGQDLAGRAFVQAEKFGAQIAVARRATAIKCDSRPFPIECDGDEPVRGQAIVIACGAAYRKLQVSCRLRTSRDSKGRPYTMEPRQWRRSSAKAKT